LASRRTRFFLLQALGLDALFLFPLRADGIGLGQVHLFALRGLRGPWLARATRLAGLARAAVAMPTTLAGLVLALASALRLSIAVATLALRAAITAGPSFLRSGLGAGLKPRPISWSRRVSLIDSDQ
jgi:hypothetical protein